MEKFQQKSNSRNFSGLKSRDIANLIHQGNSQAQRSSEDLDIISDCSCSSYSTEEDSFSYKLRRGGLRQTSEAPMKKLLAEELSKEAEVRRCPPSVIGRLMGLDALPPQQPVKKHQKKFSENYLKKTASIGCLDKRYSHEGRSHRTSSKEHQEFKDVYEVLGSSEDKKHRNLLMQEERMHSYTTNETKMEYVRQKFMDVKRLSTDQNLHRSKEFHDALEVLDSNKDLLLKFLQEPDSLFTKHLHDLHGVPSPPQPGHITVLHSSAQDNLYRRRDRNHAANSIQNYEQGSISHSRRKNVYIPSKVPKSQHHEKDATSHLPTRIVVLKPNLKKVQNTERMISSPDSSEGFLSGHRKNKESGSSESLEYFEEIRHHRDPSIELELMKHTARGSREMAREITRQMRHGIRSRSKMVQNSRDMRYSGDESSHSLSGNDSGNEMEVKTPISRHLSDLKCRYSPSSSYSTESSVSREARKRLSERWKMTQRAQEVKKGSRGNTLGEMLALPDKEAMLNLSDPVNGPDGLSDRFSRNGGINRCSTPLGISSRDGWKDEYVRSLPRSRSLPASSTSLSSPKTSTRHGSVRRCSMPKESVNWQSNTPKSIDSPQSDDFFLRRKTKPSRKKSSYSFAVSGEKNPQRQCSDLKLNEQRQADAERSHPVLDADLKPDELSLSFEQMDLHEWKPSNFDITVEDISETMPSVNIRESSADIVTPKGTPVDNNEGSSISHCTIPEVESPASSKEAEQPSPVSVLEPPFADEFSPSSNSFEQISADLHGLRMQLQLLKSDTTDAYSEGSEMIVSSDEDIKEENKTIRGEVSRDFSYITDILDSHFHNSDLDMACKTWYSPELAIAPTIFDKLEKKYVEQHMSWLRSDRKLLFDRVNLGLMELLRPYTNPHPWVQLGKTMSQWNGENVGEEVWKLLVRQEKGVERDSLEKELLKEMNWLDLGDDVNGVGNEIERLLFDDLVVEVAVSLVVV